MFKYELGQVVWFLHFNRVISSSITSRSYVDKFDLSGKKPKVSIIIRYCTTAEDGLKEENIFLSKEALIASL